MTVKLVTNDKIAETSSKGNQEKWLEDDRWYKLDQFGYEALAETFTSLLLEQSNIETDTPFHFTRYRGLSQILCKHRNTVQIEQNIFKAEVAQAAAALFSK